MKQIMYTLNDIPAVVEQLRPLVDRASVVTFTGQLGAGKTTLIRELLKAYGVTGAIQSPTFTYVQRYFPAGGRTVNHFDLYRIESLDDFYMQGFDEYLYAPDTVSFVEWPGVIESILDTGVCHITIDHVSDDKRQLTVKCID